MPQMRATNAQQGVIRGAAARSRQSASKKPANQVFCPLDLHQEASNE
jgi:hypothetical protein